MKLDSLSIVLPAYNEAANISTTIEDSVSAVADCAHEYEIIIVDDGSSDDTALIVGKLSEKSDRIRLISNEKNLGYGATVWRGIKEARHGHVFFTDADGQFDMKELSGFVPFAREHDAVIGYRRVRNDPFNRRANSFGWNMLIRILFGLKVKDINCAFKLMRRDVVASLPISTGSAMTIAEILIRLNNQGVVFKEIPVTHFARQHGKQTGAKISVVLTTFGNLFRFYGKYDGSLSSKEILKFASVGIMNTLVDIGAYTFITRAIFFFSEHFILAKIFSFFLGTLSSFFANKRWTFQNKQKATVAMVAQFYLTAAGSITINAGAMYFFHAILGWQDILSTFFAAGVTFVFNFGLSRKILKQKKTAVVGGDLSPVTIR